MGKVIKLDVRDLEPPQPLVEISRKLEELGEGDILEVLGSRPFRHLLPKLENLGFKYTLEEIPEGYLLRIYK